MAILNPLKTCLKKIYYKYNAVLIRLQERTFQNGVKYIFKDNHSENLLVVFSGIGGDYNYRRSLKYSTWDQLYIKDTWADGLSYYLFEKGENYPEMLTSELITSFIGGKYKHIGSLGSSKGGSAAIYFGLKHRFSEIYAGACQFKVGNYIGIFHKEDNYYPKLMGNIPLEEGINILNNKFEKIIETRANTPTTINLIYSTQEHTYDDDIVHLLKLLDKYNVIHYDQIESFPNHSMIGLYMSRFCKDHFK